jgi:hypothetical protein
MKTTLLAMFCMVSVYCASQVQYEKNYDSATDHNAMAQVSILGETDGNFRSLLYLKLRGFYDLSGQNLELSGSHTFGIVDERNPEKNTNFFQLNSNEFQKSNITQCGLTYNFVDETETKDIEVKLARGRNTEYVTYIPGQMRDRWGARVGIYRYAQSLALIDAPFERLEFEEGLVLPIDSLPLARDPFGYSFGQRHAAMYLGAAFHRSSALFVSTEKYGNKGARKDLIIYFDAIINLASDIESVAYEGQVYETRNISNLAKSSVGFRMGANWWVGSKGGYGMVNDFEIGMRPSYFGSNFYVQLSIGFGATKKIN